MHTEFVLLLWNDAAQWGVYRVDLTVHGDLIRLKLQDLLLKELLLDVTLQVMLAFGEPLKTHLWSHIYIHIYTYIYLYTVHHYNAWHIVNNNQSAVQATNTFQPRMYHGGAWREWPCSKRGWAPHKGGFTVLGKVLCVATEGLSETLSIAPRAHPIFFYFPSRRRRRTETARPVIGPLTKSFPESLSSVWLCTVFTLYIVYFAHLEPIKHT